MRKSTKIIRRKNPLSVLEEFVENIKTERGKLLTRSRSNRVSAARRGAATRKFNLLYNQHSDVAHKLTLARLGLRDPDTLVREFGLDKQGR